MKVLSVRSKKLFFAVRVIVYCLKSIGLAPFSATIIGNPARINPDDSPIQAFFLSKFGLAYNIIFSIPVMVLPVIYKPAFFVSVNSDATSVTNILSVISKGERGLFVSTSCFIIISWAFRQKSAACIMNRLLEVDVRLSSLKKRPFNRRALIFLILHIILTVCLWIIYWVTIYVHLDFGNPLTAFFSRLPGIIIFWFIMEYITVIGLVLRDLEIVNKYLLDFKQFGNYLSRPPVRNRIPVVSVPNHYNSQMASLKLLHNVRTTLYEVCEDIDDFFSLPILFSIACCFIPIFEKLYKFSQANDDYSPGLNACFALVYVLKYIYPTVSLTLNVTRTKREAELTGRIVHKLLAEARTEEIKSELEQFSLQLLHEEVNFTAYGLFSLDSTLLLSMLGGVTCYAVILMQFGSSVCNCDCNFNDTSRD